MVTRVEPLRARAARLPVALDRIRPWHVLTLLVLAQWAGVAAFAVTVRHNGWVWYQGGDQLWHYGSAWTLAHGQLPPALVGDLWAVLIAPIALVAGPDLAQALPAIVVLDTVLLLPVALLATYGIGERIAGRRFGYLAAALWVVLPYFGIRYALPGYHFQYTEIALPQSLGLTALSDFPSVVALVVAAYFCLRALDGDPWIEGAAAGLATGVSIAIKPSNGIFLLAAGLVLVLYRRRAIPAFAIGIAPLVLTLAVWKERGLGTLPILNGEPATRVALGAGADVLAPVHKYIHLDWNRLNQNRLGIKEHFWSERLVDFSVVAGLLGLLRRSRPAFAVVGTWFVAYLLLKGTYFGSTTDDASFFRFLMPAFPAFVILLASIVFLFPGTRSRGRTAPRGPSRRTALSALGVAGVVFGLAPLAVVAAARPLEPPAPRAIVFDGILRPVDAGLTPTAAVQGRTVHLSWRRRRPFGGSKVFFQVLASRGAGNGLACPPPGSAGAAECTLNAITRAITRANVLSDKPPRGRWTYRVGVVANWLNDTRQGDIYVVSDPVTVTIP